MTIKIVRQKIPSGELKELARQGFGDMVKGVVDLTQGILALGGELHADAEAILLEQGSRQADLWGFNVYPEKPSGERIEFSSFINIRPSQGNRSMDIQDQKLKEKIRKIIDAFI